LARKILKTQKLPKEFKKLNALFDERVEKGIGGILYYNLYEF
jgi:hypothetical protein